MSDNHYLLKNKIEEDKIKDCAFLNNDNLTELIIPENIKYIGEKAFAGCKNLKKIVLPNGLISIDVGAFSNCESLEEIIIPDSVKFIGASAFEGCKNLKKVKLSNSLNALNDFVFSKCSSLQEITIPLSIQYYSYGVFSNCENLKNVYAHNNIGFILDRAFYNCKSLTKFDVPNNTKSIGEMAFFGCENIKNIHIPKSVELIKYAAFAKMSSLERISVDPNNSQYMSIDDDTVLISKNGIIIQYAINCSQEEFTVGYYTESLETAINDDSIPIEYNLLIYNIADYAFAGAKNLKKIYIPSEIESIGGNTFLECDNLKNLEIYHSSFGNIFSIFIHSSSNKEDKIPFENIIIGEGIKTLGSDLSDFFKNAKSVTLPHSLEHIGEDVFLKSKYLKYLKIPTNIKMINPNTFNSKIDLVFDDFGTLKAKDFNMLQTKTNKNITKIYSLKDGTYYVKVDDFDVVRVSEDEINSLSKSSSFMRDKPDDLVVYLIELLSINADIDNILESIWLNPNLKNLFEQFTNNLEYVNEIASNKVSNAIRKIFENSGVSDEVLFTNVMMQCLNKEQIIKVLKNYNTSIGRFFRFCRLYMNENVGNIKIDIDNLIYYCNLLEKYQKYDKFLYNPVFFKMLNQENQEILIKYWNKNLKRLLNNSDTIFDNYGVNLNDLINLCKILGIFNDDKRISQQMCTFITEKMLNSDHPIKGNDIHTLFGEINPREEVDYEFITFFVENYNKLVELSKTKAGIIQNIYNAFRDISKTSTSHKGEQRHLKVTIEKCLDYFLTKSFEGVTEENKVLAALLQKYYSEQNALLIGEMIIKQSYNAPRNIFTKVNYDNDGNPIYSYDKKEDLIDDSSKDFYYHWLPKQDYDNLILGKYCNCCAHILGVGAGIMRASMILDNCQNLVIRNKDNNIVAKMTIYVNKDLGYAVFNTAEINIEYRSFSKEICEAFLNGAVAFVNKYNSNNSIPIKIVTIGEYRNTIKDELGNIEINLLNTPNYSNYGYYINENKIGTYDGDSHEKQILVLKK